MGNVPRVETPASRLAALGVGARVVIRYRVGDLATDVLGTVLALGPTDCTIETRRGPVVVRYEAIVAAKKVPPPPEPRERRGYSR